MWFALIVVVVYTGFVVGSARLFVYRSQALDSVASIYAFLASVVGGAIIWELLLFGVFLGIGSGLTVYALYPAIMMPFDFGWRRSRSSIGRCSAFVGVGGVFVLGAFYAGMILVGNNLNSELLTFVKNGFDINQARFFNASRVDCAICLLIIAFLQGIPFFRNRVLSVFAGLLGVVGLSISQVIFYKAGIDLKFMASMYLPTAAFIILLMRSYSALQKSIKKTIDELGNEGVVI